LADEDQTVKTMAVEKLLSHATTPPSLLVKVLDKLPANQAGQLKHLVAIWWNDLQEPNFTAWQLYSLGFDFTTKFHLVQEAEEAYKKAIALDEKYAPPWNGLGNLYQDHLGRYQEAEEAYKHYMELTQDGDRSYGLYNYLCLLGQTQKNEQKYQTQLARATEWAKETLSKPSVTTVEWIQAALLGLCSLDDLLSATLDLLRKKSMHREAQLWLAILSGIGCEATAWVMPDFAGTDFAAYELESSLRLTAMLRHRLPAPILKQLTSWLVTALKTFTPSHSSRPVSASVILPALKALDLKPFPGA